MVIVSRNITWLFSLLRFSSQISDTEWIFKLHLLFYISISRSYYIQPHLPGSILDGGVGADRDCFGFFGGFFCFLFCYYCFSFMEIFLYVNLVGNDFLGVPHTGSVCWLGYLSVFLRALIITIDDFPLSIMKFGEFCISLIHFWRYLFLLRFA